MTIDGVNPNPLPASTYLLERFLALNDKMKLETLKPGLWNRMEEALTENANAYAIQGELLSTLDMQTRFVLFCFYLILLILFSIPVLYAFDEHQS